MGIEEFHLLIAEAARLIKEGEVKKVTNLVKTAIEVICEIESFSSKLASAIELINLISALDELDENLLIQLKICVSPSYFSDKEEKLAYGRFLAYYAKVALQFNLKPIEEIEESDRILYELAKEDPYYLKIYASFTVLFYVPIYQKLGNNRKALKALDFIIDELEAIYNMSGDESIMPLLGELKLHKTKLFLELGNKEEARALLEEAKKIFSGLGSGYDDYIDFIKRLEEALL